MFNIEGVSNSIATKIASELKLDNDKMEVIAYGIFALVQMIFSIILVALFGWVFNVAIEALVISFVASILRKYSGGAHATSALRCAIIGAVVCVVQAVLFKVVLTPRVSFIMTLFLGIIVFAWSYYIIYKLAPVDSTAKPIKKKEKRERLKKSSIIILSAYFIIIACTFFIYKNMERAELLTYILCMYGAVAWQVFTLTKGGHLILGKIDTFLSIINV